MIIAIVNHKGGVGKTTTAINLSAGLSFRGYKTLLIDLDPQSHATNGLLELPRDQKTVNDILTTKRGEYPEAILATSIPNLSLIPSNIKLAVSAEHLYMRSFRERLLKDYLDTITRSFHFIIIDCPPSLSILTFNAIYAADWILIPTSPGRYSLDGIADLFNTIEELRGKTFSKFLLLITMFDTRTTATNEFIREQLTPYENILLKTVIHRTEALNQSQIAQQDIFTFKRDSKGAEDYKKLTEEILKLCRVLEIN